MSTTRNLLFVMVSMLATTPVVAADTSAWKDDNCMFRSSVSPKGGADTRTSIYKSDTAVKYQYCATTAQNDPRPASINDREYFNSQVKSAPIIRSDGTVIYQEVAPAAGN